MVPGYDTVCPIRFYCLDFSIFPWSNVVSHNVMYIYKAAYVMCIELFFVLVLQGFVSSLWSWRFSLQNMIHCPSIANINRLYRASCSQHSVCHDFCNQTMYNPSSVLVCHLCLSASVRYNQPYEQTRDNAYDWLLDAVAVDAADAVLSYPADCSVTLELCRCHSTMRMYISSSKGLSCTAAPAMASKPSHL